MLARLERIDELERRLLDELCALLDEGERWADVEGDGAEAAAAALARCRELLAGRRAAGGKPSHRGP